MPVNGLSPAPERTIAVGASGTGAVRANWPNSKDPGDTSDFWLDFSVLTAANPDTPDPIVSVSVPFVISRRDLTPPSVTSLGTDGTFVMVMLAGGEDGDVVYVSVQAKFGGGRSVTFAGILPIRAALNGAGI